MRDLPAWKSQSWTSTKPVDALKGELLITIPVNKLLPIHLMGPKMHNYRLARDATVSLRAEPGEVTPLSKHKFTLLEAIESCHTRYSVFLSATKLDWGLSLRKDSKVYVIMNPEAPQSAWVYSKAVVRWFGELGAIEKQGTFFGVEIMVCVIISVDTPLPILWIIGIPRE